MKKFFTMLLVISAVSVFALDWYSSNEKLGDVRKAPRDTKDTLWYSYCAGPAWVRGVGTERATYVNVNDFGLEYPINLHAIDSYLYEANYEYKYKVYAKNGIDVLWEMDTPDSSSSNGYNIKMFDESLIMKDDFWISVVPLAGIYPRLVSCDATTSDHSYYREDGVWLPLEDLNGRYEWAIDFVLSPYDDPVPPPPLVRDVSGLENFQDRIAEISVTTQGISPISSIIGEYSLDGGSNWIAYTMADAKITEIHKGIIPGQPNGTIALTRFDITDYYGNHVITDNYEVIWSRDIPLLDEGFENNFPPDDWTLNTTGAGFVKAKVAEGALAYTGVASLCHWDNSGIQDDWIWTPTVSLPTDNSCNLSLWQNGSWLTYYDFHEIVISTDFGLTYDQLYNGAPPSTYGDPEQGIWEQLILSLKAYSGQNIQIGFHYIGNLSDQWFIDDVKIKYDYIPPVPISLVGNEKLFEIHRIIGEYLNNPLNLKLTVTDQSELASVVGHYSFEGEPVTDLVFTKAKGTELWTGTIPARSTEATGTICLDMVDIGGVSVTSPDFEIQFVGDLDPPIIKSFSYGAPVFINQDMTLTLTFTDESEITSVKGFYSEDYFITWTEIAMIPSKEHLYTYNGVIPAKTETTFGKVGFEIIDAAGNMAGSPPPGYTVEWLNGETITGDDFESGSSALWDWTTPGTTWALTDEDDYSGSFSLTDSPGGNYTDNTQNRLMTMPMDFSSYIAAEAYFWAKIDIEPDWEYFMIQGTTSTDAVPDDLQWTTLFELSGYNLLWQLYELNLSGFAGQVNVRLRLKIDSDTYVNADGVYFDDFDISGFFEDSIDPYIIYPGPDKISTEDYIIPREFTIPVGMGDYSFNVELYDPAGISEVKVIYSVDGRPEQESIPDVSSGTSGIYELNIPEQPAGSQVFFKITATDASEYLNQYITQEYMIRFGNFQYYQNGDEYVDYLDIIGTTAYATAQAVANRVTMGPMGTGKGHYKSNLVGITIDNYIDTDGGYPSDPMYVHVWQNEGGVPGKDIIEPLYVAPACIDASNYEITYVDLRAYATELSGIEGDVFVGYTTAGTQTLLLYEVAASHISDSCYVAFERSWLGTDNGNGELTWVFDPADVYHISAVIDNYEYIDAPVYPTALQAISIEPGIGIHLSWAANTEANLAFYNIYRDVMPNFIPVTPIGSVEAPAVEYLATVPYDGVSYFKITAVDSLGNESKPSNEITVAVTGISENIPLTTELFQNYPNPFNPVTTIRFDLAKDSKVSLKVYDVMGREVAKLVDKEMVRGTHNVSFDASSLVSGVYYYTFKAGDVNKTRKMMLIK